MAAKKRKPAPPKDKTVEVRRADVMDALTTFDALEQLLELLKGPLNGGTEIFVNDLISMVQDRLIASVRIRLALAAGSGAD